MNRSLCRTVLVSSVILSLAMLGISSHLPAQENAQGGQPFQQGQSVDQQGVETLTRGPIHEAFAEVVPFDPQPGITVSKQPPEPIEEALPDQRPEDENAIWISGYWGWDEDRSDFIWVSGVWRVPPPGSQWVPGYWTQAENGYQWIAGFWWYESEDQQQAEQVSYLPVPPQSLESGPSSPQPSEDQFWVPGCWVWQEKYVWRPGYWAPIRPNWVWVPDHYLWTPSGCVFVAGHWDYTLPRRGLCFAPAYFQPAVYTQPTFRYVPAVVIDVRVVHYHLFCQPRYYHYYFGDYYGPEYSRVGIVPWFELYHSNVGYEPFYVYNRWYFSQHQREADWSGRIRKWYDYRVRHEDARPPRTYAKMAELLRSPDGRRSEMLEVAVSLDRAASRKEFPIRLARVDEPYRERMLNLRKEVRDYSRERVQFEKQLRERTPGGKLERPEQVKVPRPPISGERLNLADRRDQPERPDSRQKPERPDAPGRKAAPGAKPEAFEAPTPVPPDVPDRPGPGKPEEKPGFRRPTPGKPDRADRPEKARPPEGMEKPDSRREPRDGRRGPETPGAPDRPEGPGARDRFERPGTPGKPEVGPGTERRGEAPDRPRGRDDRPGRPGGAEKPETPQQPGFQRPPQPGGPSEQPRTPRERGPDRGAGDRPGGETPRQPQGFRQPDRSDQQQPGTRGPGQPDSFQRRQFGAPDQPDRSQQRERFQRPDTGPSRQPDGFQRRDSRPQEPQGPSGPGADRQRSNMFQRPERPDQPQGFQGQRGPERPSRDAGPQSPRFDQGPRGGRPDASPSRSFGGGEGDGARGRETPGSGSGRSGGRDFLPSSPRGPSTDGGRPEARQPERGGDDGRGSRRGRGED